MTPEEDREERKFWSAYRGVILAALFVFLVLVVMSRAHAADAYVYWNVPHWHLDGTPADESEITSITVEWGKCLGDTMITVEGSMTDPTGQTRSAHVEGLSAGDHCFRVFANGTDRDGETLPVSLTLALATSSTTAYTIGRDRAIWRMLPVGTVPLNTPCRQAVQIAGLYQIPNDKVTTTSKAAWFFGKCQ